MYLNINIFSKGRRLYSFYYMKSAKCGLEDEDAEICADFVMGVNTISTGTKGRLKREVFCLCTRQKPQHKVTAMSLQQREVWHLGRAAGRAEGTLSLLEVEGIWQKVICRERIWQYMVWNWPPEENPFSLSTVGKPQTSGQHDTACYSFLQV